MADDIQILRRITQRDQSALSELYDNYSAMLYSLALKIVRDPTTAQGVVQKTFVTVWDKADRFDSSKAKASTWLISIARNQAIDQWRKQQRSREVEDLEVLDRTADDSPQTDPLRSAIDQERTAILREALAEIPEEQKRAIYLSYYTGLSHQEIADHLQEPLGTVKTRIQLGLGKLRRRLEPIFRHE